MAQIQFTIPDNKLQRVIDAFKGFFPIPTAEDKDTGEVTPQFADGEWAKEVVRRYIISVVRRYEQRKAMDEAAKKVAQDDTIAQ